MIVDRYYYNRLSDSEKNIYATLYKGIIDLEKEIHFSKILSKREIENVFFAISKDNPHLYYFNQTHMDIHTSPYESVLLPQYFCDKEQIETYNKRIEVCVTDIISNLDLLNCSNYEKVKRLHDYFCLNIEYDHEALHTTKVKRLVAAHSIIGVLAKQRAVCEGIAKAFKFILNIVDIACIVVDGTASLIEEGGHSWNIVKIEENPYQIDVTWDLANTKDDLINYDYFCLPDDEIIKDHFDFKDTPKCMVNDYSYFNINNVMFNTVKELEVYLLEEIKNGKKDFYFKIADEGHSIEDVIMYARKFVISEAGNNGVLAKVKSYYNKDQRTGRVFLLMS